MTMQTNRACANGLAQPRRSVQSARNAAPPPLPDAARRPRRDVQPPPPVQAPSHYAPPPQQLAPQYAPPPAARPMPVPVRRDDLDATIVKPIAMLTARKAEEPVVVPREDPLSPATEARAATTAHIRRRSTFAFSRAAVERAMKRLASDYRELSAVKRLLIPIAVILLFAAAPSSSRAGESATRTAPVATTAVKVAPLASAPTLSAGAVLPSARALAPSAQTALSPEERRQYDRAISATIGGDFDSAQTIYTQLAAAHPESTELSAAARVLAAKKKKKAAR